MAVLKAKAVSSSIESLFSDEKPNANNRNNLEKGKQDHTEQHRYLMVRAVERVQQTELAERKIC